MMSGAESLAYIQPPASVARGAGVLVAEPPSHIQVLAQLVHEYSKKNFILFNRRAVVFLDNP